MNITHTLSIPISDTDLFSLAVGDVVLLSGVVYTARDAAHERIAHRIRTHQSIPFPLKHAAIFYAGPSPARPGAPVGAIGPTTSYRMDPYMPLFLEHGLRITIGKGPRSLDVIRAQQQHKALYLVAPGGVAAYLAQCVTHAEIIAFPDLDAEAVRALQVKDFPCIVANDIHGNDIFRGGKK